MNIFTVGSDVTFARLSKIHGATQAKDMLSETTARLRNSVDNDRTDRASFEPEKNWREKLRRDK
jgi:hypothetical protein